MLTSVADGSVHAVARNFMVDCPVHGERIYQKFGHHSTLSESKAKNALVEARERNDQAQAS
jgi:hypothetical protein